MESKFDFLGIEFYLNNDKLVKGVLTAEKKKYHCNGNNPNDFISFVCKQVKLKGFNAKATDINFDGSNYTFNICEE